MVMILVGLLRHNITILFSSTPKVDPKAVREAYVGPRSSGVSHDLDAV